MKGLGDLARTLVVSLTVCFGLAAADPVIGIYFNPRPEKELAIVGYEGTKMALEDEGYEDQVRYIRDLEPETLRQLDVLILSCVYGYPKEWKEGVLGNNLRQFVEGSGGILLINESVGWRRAFAKAPPFPEIGRGTGKGDQYMNSMSSGVGPARTKLVSLEVADKTHPITNGVAAFEALHDMPDLEVGKSGKVLMKRKEGGAAVVVAGTFGKGRVVLIAPTLGAGRRNLEQAPKGSALKLLLNAVEWAAGGD